LSGPIKVDPQAASLVYLAHGDWEASCRMHRIGWLMALAVLLQFPYRIVALRRADRQFLGHWFPTAVGFTLIVLLVGNWLWDLVF
jgi:hypothetical protein